MPISFGQLAIDGFGSIDWVCFDGDNIHAEIRQEIHGSMIILSEDRSVHSDHKKVPVPILQQMVVVVAN